MSTTTTTCNRCSGTGRTPVNPTDLATLAALDRPKTVKDLAADLDLSVNTVHIRLERMRDRGLVVRQERAGKQGMLYAAK